MPDGKTITIGTERFRSTEHLFVPLEKNGKNDPSIQEIIFNSIQECHVGIRCDLYENIILSGGNTMLEGFRERIFKEIESRAPSCCNVNV
jgi:actin-related protein